MMEERRKLSASIAHDLRTPITVMKGCTEYLSHNVPLGRISEDKLMDTIHNLSLATESNWNSTQLPRCAKCRRSDAVPVKRGQACPLREFFEEREDEYTVLAHQHQLQFSMDSWWGPGFSGHAGWDSWYIA